MVLRYVITKFSRMDILPNFVTHSAPLRARESSAVTQLKCAHALMRVNTSLRLINYADPSTLASMQIWPGSKLTFSKISARKTAPENSR